MSLNNGVAFKSRHLLAASLLVWLFRISARQPNLSQSSANLATIIDTSIFDKPVIDRAVIKRSVIKRPIVTAMMGLFINSNSSDSIGQTLFTDNRLRNY